MWLVQKLLPGPVTWRAYSQSVYYSNEYAPGSLGSSSGSGSASQSGMISQGRTMFGGTAEDASPAGTGHGMEGSTADAGGYTYRSAYYFTPASGTAGSSSPPYETTFTQSYDHQRVLSSTTTGYRPGFVSRTTTTSESTSRRTTYSTSTTTAVSGGTTTRETHLTQYTWVGTTLWTTMAATALTDQPTGILGTVVTVVAGPNEVVADDYWVPDERVDWIWQVTGASAADTTKLGLVEQIAQSRGGSPFTAWNPSTSQSVSPTLGLYGQTSYVWYSVALSTQSYRLVATTTQTATRTRTGRNPLQSSVPDEIPVAANQTWTETCVSTGELVEILTLNSSTQLESSSGINATSTTTRQGGQFQQSTTMAAPRYDTLGRVVGTRQAATTTTCSLTFSQVIEADAAYTAYLIQSSGDHYSTYQRMEGFTQGVIADETAVRLTTQRGSAWWMQPKIESGLRFGSEGRYLRLEGKDGQTIPYPWFSTPFAGIHMPMTFPESREALVMHTETDGLDGQISSATFRWSQSAGEHTVSVSRKWEPNPGFTASTSDSLRLRAYSPDGTAYFETFTAHGISARTDPGGGGGGSVIVGGAQWPGARDSAVLGRGVWEVSVADTQGGTSVLLTTVSDHEVVTAASSVVSAFRVRDAVAPYEAQGGPQFLLLGPLWDDAG